MAAHSALPVEEEEIIITLPPDKMGLCIIWHCKHLYFSRF